MGILKKEKFKNYLFYALGEITLVVVGILIAVQINDYVESRRELRLQLKYLKKVQKELQQDTANFSDALRRSDRVIALHVASHEILNDPQSNDSLLVAAVSNIYNKAMFFPEYNPVQSTYAELINTGRLGIISSDTLRDHIVKHYTYYSAKVQDYISYRNRKLDFEVRLWYDYPMLKHLGMTSSLYAREDRSQTAAFIRSNVEKYLNHSAINVVIKELITGICWRSYDKSLELLAEIDSEIKMLEGK